MSFYIPDGAYESQINAINVVCNHTLEYLANHPQLSVVRVIGGAGAGKSWTTCNGIIPNLVGLLDKSKTSLAITTTTHQANKVMNQELYNCGLPYEAITIHSYLELTPWSNTCTGNPPQFRDCGYKLGGSPDYRRQVVIIDEAFRLGNEMWKLMEYLRPNTLWVCIYDAYQTPPVGEYSSPIDDLCEEDSPKTRLLESPRFINSGALAQLVTDMRICVSEQKPNYMDVFNSYKGKAFTEGSRKEYGEQIRLSILNNEPLNPDHLMVCGTRKQAVKYNNAIHSLRAKANQPIFQPDDPILPEWLVGANDDPVMSDMRKTRLWLDNLELISDEERRKSEVLRNFKQVYRYKNQNRYIIPLFDANQSAPYWLTRKCYKEGIILIGVRLNYARTIHTAQGMTVPHVYIDISSIYAWSSHDMRRRLLYTGASRSSLTLSVIE